MAKRRTVLIVILSLFLAAVIAAAGVLGVTLSRSAFSDASTGETGEARWAVTEKTVGEITEESVSLPIEKIRPYYKSYEAHIFELENSSGTGWSLRPDDPGIQMYEHLEDTHVIYTARTREFFGVVATLENAGDVAAAVTIEPTDGFRFDTDGCGINDQRYEDDEIAAHFECELYWSKVGSYEKLDDVKSGQASETLTLEAGGEDVVYFYARVVWNTDLDEDMFVTDTNGNKTLNGNYDGTQGDEFDTWAGEHLTGITLSVKVRAEQAE